MKIKNVALFRRRARAHAKAGHVTQGTYGSGKVNGHAEYKGCFVSCLATPHQKGALTKYIKDKLKAAKNPYQEDPHTPLGGLFYLNTNGPAHKRIITKEFGLCPELLTVIEGFFEAQRTHGAAINFVPAVAAALNEGADIKPSAVQRFIQNELGLQENGRHWIPSRYSRYSGAGFIPGHWEKKPLCVKRNNWNNVKLALQDGSVPQQTEQFLAWLEAQTA